MKGLVPHLAAKSVVGETVDALGQPVRVDALDDAHDPRVDGAPPVLEQAAVGDLVGQRVLEGVLEVGKELGLVDELGGLKPRQAETDFVLRPLGRFDEQGPWQVFSDDRCRL